MKILGADLVAILNVGIIGLGFLLACLVDRLVAKGQRGGSIAAFMGFSLGLVLIGLVSQTMQKPPELLVQWSCYAEVGEELSAIKKALNTTQSNQDAYLNELNTKIAVATESWRNSRLHPDGSQELIELDYKNELQRQADARRNDFNAQLKPIQAAMDKLENKCRDAGKSITAAL